jgi:hypothetical protein
MQANKPALRTQAAPPAKPPSEASVLMTDPDLFALYAKSFRANLPSRYGLFYQAMGLTPDQIDKVNDLFAQQDLEKWKLMMAGDAQGLDRSDSDIQTLLQQLRAKYGESLVAIVGETAANQFHQLNNRGAPFNLGAPTRVLDRSILLEHFDGQRYAPIAAA